MRFLEAPVRRLVEAGAADVGGKQRLVGDAARLVVRVDVALAPAELLRARIVGVAQRVGRQLRAVLADVAHRLADRRGRRVRLGRERQIGRRLREVEGALGHPDPVDGRAGRGRDGERPRVGVADVLRGEDDHAPRDEARILPALEHHGEVIDGRVGVRAARRLDPAPRCSRSACRPGGRMRSPCAGARPRRSRGRSARRRRVPSRPRARERRARRGHLRPSDGQELERLGVDLRRIGDSPLRILERAAQERLDVVRAELAKLVDLAARQERGVHLEVRVLGRRADQGHEPLLDRRQQRVLLRLVEAVDLVEEENRPPT